MGFITAFPVFLHVLTMLQTKVITPMPLDSLDVNTTHGTIRGKLMYSATGQSIAAFLGVPYARAPIGKLRFSKPESPDPWSGVLKTTRLASACPQKCVICPEPIPVSEDCLKMNIWVPRSNLKNGTVMVYIHGGNFNGLSASMSWYDGKILAAEANAIVIGMNYRLNALGFLYFGTSSAPGNMQLWDQALALKWIKENVANFGGNPENILLFGQSSGAACVHYHMLSPVSSHLFQRAALMSGSAMAEWSFAEDKEEVLRSGLELAAKVGCNENNNQTTNYETIVECLQNKPHRQIANEAQGMAIPYQMRFPFIPIVDGEFLTDTPRNLMASGKFKKTEVITGLVENEGTLFIYLLERDNVRPEDNQDVNLNVVDDIMERRFGYPEIVRKATFFQYANPMDLNSSEAIIDGVDKALNDRYFWCQRRDINMAVSREGFSVYSYLFSFRSPSNALLPDWTGVLHGDDAHFVFGSPLNPKRYYNDDEKHFSQRIIKYWSNFARTGDPNLLPNGKTMKIPWPKYTLKERSYVQLKPFLEKVLTEDRDRFCFYWNRVLPEFIEDVEKLSNSSSC